MNLDTTALGVARNAALFVKHRSTVTPSQDNVMAGVLMDGKDQSVLNVCLSSLISVV